MTIDPRSGGGGRPKQRARGSMKVERVKMAKQVGSQDPDQLMVRDLGLLPLTMVYPTGANMPSILSLKARGRLLFRWARTKISDFIGRNWAYKSLNKAKNKRLKRPKVKLESRSIAPTAAEIHRQVYTAFAAGDRDALRRLCVETVLSSYLAKLAARPADRRMRWQVVRELARPHLVSHRTSQIPFKVKEEEAGMRQCVVRLKTLQRLQSGTVKSGESRVAADLPLAARRSGSVVPKAEAEEGEEIEWQPPIEKEVTEYIVIQRWQIQGVEEPWVMWGFTEETLPEEPKALVKTAGMERLA